MSRGYPSVTALLALLAFAGYQNRDKLADLLRGAQRNPGTPAQVPEGGTGGVYPETWVARSAERASATC
jgi:hypothetical protein